MGSRAVEMLSPCTVASPASHCGRYAQILPDGQGRSYRDRFSLPSSWSDTSTVDSYTIVRRACHVNPPDEVLPSILLDSLWVSRLFTAVLMLPYKRRLGSCKPMVQYICILGLYSNVVEFRDCVWSD